MLYLYHSGQKKQHLFGFFQYPTSIFDNYATFKLFKQNNKRKNMKNITKFILVLVSSLSLSVASYAGELAVTGSANASYTIGGADDSTDKGIGISNELAFTATGELDNGFTWKYQMELDGNDGGAHDNDDSRLEIGMGDMGTIGIYNSEGGMSQELGWGTGAMGTGSDYAGNMTVQYGLDVDGSPNVQYHTAAGLLPFGVQAKIGFAPNTGDGDNNSYKSTGGINPETQAGAQLTQYVVTAAPIDGLKVGVEYAEGSDTISGQQQKPTSGNYYAQYAVGNFKIGYADGFYEPGLTDKDTAVTQYLNDALGIEFAVNDALTVSYSEETHTAETSPAIAATASGRAKTTVDSEVETMQIAYNIGGATLGLVVNETSNSDYVASKDEKVTVFAIEMAF